MASGAAGIASTGINVAWNKCAGDQWCSLLHINLEDPRFRDREGVYVIWHGGPSAAVVYVGSGKIVDRLRAHRSDGRFLPYAGLGLGVTWAEVPPEQQRGVERFLADTMRPTAGGRYPNADPIAVNSPW